LNKLKVCYVRSAWEMKNMILTKAEVCPECQELGRKKEMRVEIYESYAYGPLNWLSVLVDRRDERRHKHRPRHSEKQGAPAYRD